MRRRPELAVLALVAFLCFGLALAGGIAVGILPPLMALVTPLDRGTVLRVAARIVAVEPPADASTSRGPPFPSSL